MRFRGIDLNLLVVLEALLEEKSVSTAARRLHRSQSAVSGSLGRLRDHFQDPLLVPLGHRLVLTAFGERLVEPVQNLMRQIGETFDLGASFDPATSRRHFKVAAIDFVAEVILPGVIARLAREAPGVVLEIVSASGASAEMIENGEVDLAVVTEQGVSTQFHSEFLLEDEYVAVGWNGNHRLSGPLTTKAFFELGRVVRRFGRGRGITYAESQLEKFADAKRIELYAPSYKAMVQYLINTDRVAVMHRSLAEFYARTWPLTIAGLPFELQPMRVLIQHHAVRANDPGIGWLKGVIRDAPEQPAAKPPRAKASPTLELDAPSLG